MAFGVSDRTLERLEWPTLVARLAAHLRTPAATAALDPLPNAGRQLFESGAEGVRERLAETSEARRLLDRGRNPPLGGAADLASALSRLRRGGALAARELLDLKATLGVLGDLAHFLRGEAPEAPRLAGIGAAIADLGDLAEEIGFSVDPDGQVRDDASPALRVARREARALSTQLTRRIEALLRDPDVAAALSDSFYTLRNDRYVLPVRADARRRVPGIVHDASASGTTLFVEPEAVVDPNNRLKQAELTAEREARRILRELSARAAAALPEIETSMAALEAVDRAFARGSLSREMDAVEPEVGNEGIFRLPALRHPLIPEDEVVANDVRLGEDFSVLVLSGPNAGGKTVTLKALALCALLVRAGLHVPSVDGARVDLVDSVLAEIGDAQDLQAHLSTFSAHLASLVRIVEEATSRRALVVIDEIGVGTDPGEGAALAQAVLEALAEREARVVTTTHYGLLKEAAALDPRFENACVEFDPETLAPTYRLRFGVPGASSAAVLAERMGLGGEIVARARALLGGDDRRLQDFLDDLARSRAELERERAGARRLRAEAEALREEHQRRLRDVREGHRELTRRLRRELEAELRAAHAEVARVIRELQRSGSARGAARAREQLLAVEARLADPKEAPGEAGPADPGEAPIDWARVRPGDAVRVRDGDAGRLVSLPDRRGRVAVQLGSARLVLPQDRLCASHAPGPSPPLPRFSQPALDSQAEQAGDPGQCDLRGLRVEEAVERLDAALDRALASGRQCLRLVHGHGTGALREAVRSHLARLPHVLRYEPGEIREGGEGVTVAWLA